MKVNGRTAALVLCFNVLCSCAHRPPTVSPGVSPTESGESHLKRIYIQKAYFLEYESLYNYGYGGLILFVEPEIVDAGLYRFPFIGSIEIILPEGYPMIDCFVDTEMWLGFGYQQFDFQPRDVAAHQLAGIEGVTPYFKVHLPLSYYLLDGESVDGIDPALLNRHDIEATIDLNGYMQYVGADGRDHEIPIDLEQTITLTLAMGWPEHDEQSDEPAEVQ